MFWPNPPARLTRVARIAEGEPGELLNVAGQVFAPDGRTPAPGLTVYAYDTDAEGYYGAGHTDYSPRLHGWMLTDDAVSFEWHTIRPGHYPGMRVPAHIQPVTRGDDGGGHCAFRMRAGRECNFL